MSTFSPRRRQIVVIGAGPGADALLTGLRGADLAVSARPAAAIDPPHRRIRTPDGRESAYDTLVLAVGAQFRGPDEPGWTDLSEAREWVTHRVRLAVEFAESEPDPAERERLLSFAVIGTGAAAREVAHLLQEAEDRLVSPEFRDATGQRGRILSFGHDDPAAAKAGTLIHTAGLTPGEAAAMLGTQPDAAGRLPVTDRLALPFHPEILIVRNASEAVYVANAIRAGIRAPYRRPRLAPLARLATQLRTTFSPAASARA